jgi:hypothetical protein
LIESVKNTKNIGTSTFVAVKMNQGEAVIDGLNLGDSGYMIIRKNIDNQPIIPDTPGTKGELP